jgi:putative ATP-binding cassette transporter
VLAYPAEIEQFRTSQYVKALERMRLSRLIPMLDRTRRWEQELNETEQQQLAFARLVLKIPAWLLIDEVLDSLDPPTLETVKDVLGHELRQTGLIHIGRELSTTELYSRVLHLVNDPNARKIHRPLNPDHSRERHRDVVHAEH